MPRKITCTLENLGCANCAAKMEHEIGALKGVESAIVDFNNKRLFITFASSAVDEEIISSAQKIVSSIEQDVLITFSESARKKLPIKQNVIRLSVGIVLYLCAFTLEILHAPLPFYVSFYLLAFAVAGALVLHTAARNMIHGRIFDENFLMCIATIGAFAIFKFEEAAAVMLFYGVGELLEQIATARSVKSVEKLMDIRPDYANLLTENVVMRVAPETVGAGALIEIRPGEKVPLDGEVISGISYANTAAMTGEPMPRAVTTGSEVLAGFINISGLLTVRVTRPFGESSAARILELMKNAGAKKAKTERFITRFARYYTPAVTIIALLTAVLPWLFFGQSFSVWLYRALTFLVVSCPCALVISVPLTFFAALGAASRAGILIKGGGYLELLAKPDTIIFDKTGTLTKGVFEVVDIAPTNGVLKETLLKTAAMAEAASNHPIALSIRRLAGNLVTEKPDAFTETPGLGIKAVFGKSEILAGNEKLMIENNVLFEKYSQIGTVIHVAENGKYLGCISVADVIKPDAAAALKALRILKVRKTVMLTGDNKAGAELVAQNLELLALHAGLLPQQKVELLEEYQKNASGTVVFVGDGINDAPVLARADIGIAMGGIGSDAAVEAADVVIMTDEISKIPVAIGIARFTMQIARQNIILALTIKFAVIILAAFGLANMWAAVFADVGVALLAVLNAMRVQVK